VRGPRLRRDRRACGGRGRRRGASVGDRALRKRRRRRVGRGELWGRAARLASLASPALTVWRDAFANWEVASLCLFGRGVFLNSIVIGWRGGGGGLSLKRHKGVKLSARSKSDGFTGRVLWFDAAMAEWVSGECGDRRRDMLDSAAVQREE